MVRPPSDEHRNHLGDSDENGSATVVAGAVVVLIGALTLGLSRFGSYLLDDIRVCDAADAVALAGALGGRDAAARLAASHGVELRSFTVDGSDVVVTVFLRPDHRATSRAHGRPKEVPITVIVDAPADELVP